MGAKEKPKPSFTIEHREVAQIGQPIAGVDEAGRGPLAGPVIAAAVIFPRHVLNSGLPAPLSDLNDSKVLNETTRESLFDSIRKVCCVGIGMADVERIDRDNILNATMWAMRQAVNALGESPALVLVDGNRCPEFNCPTRCVIKGDSKSLTISAASIVAKVTRDRIMVRLAHDYPNYGFEVHKGYATKSHLSALDRFGPTEVHRKSFRPVQLARTDNA
ncbi:MAG: ribonuclease HII [Hyphomicrobiaceae bacterium]